MRTFSRVGWLIAALVCGCGSTPESGVDASLVDGDVPQVDGGDSGALCVRFSSKPEVPDSAGGLFDARIDTADMTLSAFRAIGDAAPGDERTTISYVELNFEESPETRCFPAAPPGVYSHFTATISHYHLTGSVDVGERESFEIDDSEPIDIVINLEGGVVHEDDTTVDVDVDLGDIVVAVDWSEVEGDPLTVDGDSSQIDVVRGEVADSFESDDD